LGGGAAAVAAWKPPGRSYFEVMPPSVFLPVARFRAASFETADAAVERPYFEWDNAEHSQVDELALVDVQFRVPSTRGSRARKTTEVRLQSPPCLKRTAPRRREKPAN